MTLLKLIAKFLVNSQILPYLQDFTLESFSQRIHLKCQAICKLQ